MLEAAAVKEVEAEAHVAGRQVAPAPSLTVQAPLIAKGVPTRVMEGACGAVAAVVPLGAAGALEATTSRVALEVRLLARQVPAANGVGPQIVAAGIESAPRKLLAAIEAPAEAKGGLATTLLPVPKVHAVRRAGEEVAPAAPKPRIAASVPLPQSGAVRP